MTILFFVLLVLASVMFLAGVVYSILDLCWTREDGS